MAGLYCGSFTSNRGNPGSWPGPGKAATEGISSPSNTGRRLHLSLRCGVDIIFLWLSGLGTRTRPSKCPTVSPRGLAGCGRSRTGAAAGPGPPLPAALLRGGRCAHLEGFGFSVQFFGGITLRFVYLLLMTQG